MAHLAFDGMGAAVAWLAPALEDLMMREPTAYVALLTRDTDEAIAWYYALERSEVGGLNLVDEETFLFEPGIEVADIRSSKGLEFDYVVLLGVDADRYRADPDSRHLLHVGATRASHQLWIVSTGDPSPLIPPGLAGLVDLS